MNPFKNLFGSEVRSGYLFLLPNLIGFLAFMLVPLLFSLFLSFTDWQMLTDSYNFVGLQNFIDVLGFERVEGAWVANDPQFWKYLGNTIYIMISIPISMALSLLLALLVNNKIRGIMFFRVFFFLPTICSGVAIYMVWRLMYHYDWGMINLTLDFFGIRGPDWLNSLTWSKPAIVILSVWAAAGGYNMILYLAALQGIPPQLYEAASIDGAGSYSKFLHVTIPMVAPTTFFIFTMGMIGGFQGGFESAYMMTKGGPAGSTTTLSYYIYNTAYTGQLKLGYGCTIAWVLFALVFVVTLLNWRYGGKSSTEGWMS